jgi:hypothetical protein
MKMYSTPLRGSAHMEVRAMPAADSPRARNGGGLGWLAVPHRPRHRPGVAPIVPANLPACVRQQRGNCATDRARE